MTKEELLAQLNELGVHKSGRKVRADKGQSHNYTKTRADKGTSRSSYSKETPAYAKRQFENFIRVHRDPAGFGDTLVRDANMIFPPNTTHYYKTITVKSGTRVDKRTNTLHQTEAYSYKTSRKRPNHPEELRWRWWFREYQQATSQSDKDKWAKRICDWYFIKMDDINDWTYAEWSWAYVYGIGGHANRDMTDPEHIILSYDFFLQGGYTIPQFDIDGNVIWNK